MNLALWIIAIVLAVVFAASGLMKCTQDKLVTARAGAGLSPANIRPSARRILGASG
jgi:uncharacterized membrane protein YphA (DoxX/SURF4 family)